jgi:hypothetical protein
MYLSSESVGRLGVLAAPALVGLASVRRSTRAHRAIRGVAKRGPSRPLPYQGGDLLLAADQRGRCGEAYRSSWTATHAAQSAACG